MSSQFESFDKAYMEALTTLHQSVSAKYIKKPIEIKAQQTNETKVIKTLEGDVTANPSDWIVTGIAGEQYPIVDSQFKEIYEPIENGKFKRKPIKVTAWQTNRELLIPYGENTLKASIGDYIVKHPNGNFAPVKPDIFKQTYDKCEQ